MRAVSALVLAGALLLSGCGDAGSENDSSASTTEEASSQDTAEGTAGVGDASEATEAVADSESEEGAQSQQNAAEDGEAADGEQSSQESEKEGYSYPDEPEPAPEVAATLCNLDADYFKNLRPTNASGDAVVDDSLRMSVLSLG
ncbi:MAG: hypothetical protein WBG57_10095, partial [Ornithinimicrobium sp.]